MDGGIVTAPNLGHLDRGGWVVENAGVQPDIEVEQPADVIAGKELQLDRAIQSSSTSSKNPPKPLTAPAVPGEGEEVSGVAAKVPSRLGRVLA